MVTFESHLRGFDLQASRTTTCVSHSWLW